MVKRLIFFVLLASSLWGCKEDMDFPFAKDFPVVITGDYIRINYDEVILQGEVVIPDNLINENLELEFGFIVLSKLSQDTFFLGTTSKTLFFEFNYQKVFLQDTPLTIYAFAKKDSLTYMGNRIGSLLGKEFIISEVVPSIAVWQDTVIIKGSRLGEFPDETHVHFRQAQDFPATILAIDSNFIQVIVPGVNNTGPWDLHIDIAGIKVKESGLFRVAQPEVTEVNPVYGFEGDTVRIIGSYLGHFSTTDPSQTTVSINGRNLPVLSWNNNEIKILLNDLKLRQEGSFIIKYRNKHYSSLSSFLLVSPWVKLRDLSATSLIHGGKGFAFRGFGMVGHKMHSRYYPNLNHWTSSALSINSITDYAPSWVANNRAFIVASLENNIPNTYSIYEFIYTSEVRIWEHMGSKSLPNYIKRGFTTVVANNRAFLLTANYQEPSATNFFEIEPENNLWSPAPQFPGGMLENAFAMEINSMAYFGTGLINGASVKMFYRYEPVGQTWTQMADFPVDLHNGIGFSLDGKGYAGMGISTDGNTYDRSIYSYDPQIDEWKWAAQFPNNLITQHSFVFTIGNVAFIGSTQISTNNFFEFDPAYLRENYQHNTQKTKPE